MHKTVVASLNAKVYGISQISNQIEKMLFLQSHTQNTL